MKKHRIFISINIPNELKNILEAYLESFYKQRFVRILEKDGWHITVIFCGYLNETEIEKLKETMARKVSLVKSFSLSPTLVSFAPPNRPARMVWLMFKESSEFLKLSNDSTPHVTLVRFDPKYFHNLKKLLPEKGVDVSNDAKPFLVDSINIMESHLSREGAKYKLIEKINFFD